MNFEQCLKHLERLGNEVHGMKFGLDTTQALMAELHHPHLKCPSVLIAGTNGKGSVARMLQSICSAAGVRTGLYTSPHLVRIEERIQVDQTMIGREEFADSFSRVVGAADALSLAPSFFELLTCTAFDFFAREQVELAVLEVGMGGRLDSTNVAQPLLSVITTIGMDHRSFLGNSVREIAWEKAGIMRESKLSLSAVQSTEAADALLQAARRKGARLEFLDVKQIALADSTRGLYAFHFEDFEIQLGVPGIFQVWNACLSIRAVQALRRSGFSISDAAVTAGLSSLRLPAVLQIVRENPLLIVDGGHNRDAAASLANFVEDFTDPPRSLVFGIMKDKEVSEVLDRLGPLFDRIYLTRVDSDRAASIEELNHLCPNGIPSPDRKALFEEVLESDQTVVIAGSFYLAGAFLKFHERRAGS